MSNQDKYKNKIKYRFRTIDGSLPNLIDGINFTKTTLALTSKVDNSGKLFNALKSLNAKYLIDATACIGGHTITASFMNVKGDKPMFSKILAYEKDTNTYNMLNNNIELYGRTNITTLNQEFTINDDMEILSGFQDIKNNTIVVIDPEWIIDYSQELSDTMFILSDMKFSGYTLEDLATKLLTKYAYVIYHVPKKYKFNNPNYRVLLDNNPYSKHKIAMFTNQGKHLDNRTFLVKDPYLTNMDVVTQNTLNVGKVIPKPVNISADIDISLNKYIISGEYNNISTNITNLTMYNGEMMLRGDFIVEFAYLCKFKDTTSNIILTEPRVYDYIFKKLFTTLTFLDEYVQGLPDTVIINRNGVSSIKCDNVLEFVDLDSVTDTKYVCDDIIAIPYSNINDHRIALVSTYRSVFKSYNYSNVYKTVHWFNNSYRSASFSSVDGDYSTMYDTYREYLAFSSYYNDISNIVSLSADLDTLLSQNIISSLHMHVNTSQLKTVDSSLKLSSIYKGSIPDTLYDNKYVTFLSSDTLFNHIVKSKNVKVHNFEDPISHLSTDSPILEFYKKLEYNAEVKKYKKANNYMYRNIHWGQLKLLSNEIEFLTRVRTERNSDENVNVFYVGAADGEHIKVLSGMFPKYKFYLYDGGKFKITEEKNKIMIFNQMFTDETATDIASKFKGEYNVFISDIRLDTAADRIKQDMTSQYNWWRIINPELSMFKFRLPWDNGLTMYPVGDIMLQPFTGVESTETRLIVKKNAKITSYNNRRYEELCFHHNTVTRTSKFVLEKFGDLSLVDDGVCNCWDCTRYLEIVDNYLNQPSKTEVLDYIKYLNVNVRKGLTLVKETYKLQNTIATYLNYSNYMQCKQTSCKFCSYVKLLHDKIW